TRAERHVQGSTAHPYRTPDAVSSWWMRIVAPTAAMRLPGSGAATTPLACRWSCKASGECWSRKDLDQSTVTGAGDDGAKHTRREACGDCCGVDRPRPSDKGAQGAVEPPLPAA